MSTSQNRNGPAPGPPPSRRRRRRRRSLRPWDWLPPAILAVTVALSAGVIRVVEGPREEAIPPLPPTPEALRLPPLDSEVLGRLRALHGPDALEAEPIALDGPDRAARRERDRVEALLGLPFDDPAAILGPPPRRGPAPPGRLPAEGRETPAPVGAQSEPAPLPEPAAGWLLGGGFAALSGVFYLMPTSSTSKVSAAPPGIFGGAPRSP